MRKYIRHPVNVPIQYRVSGKSKTGTNYTKNISLGGLCFTSESCVDEDVILSIKIPVIKPEFTVEGQVVWCQEHGQNVEIGVKFLYPGDSFKTRMIEQICYIKEYQKMVRKEQGRNLTDREAALEWIGKYAKDFPQ
ncbi:MAG TPA: PilZ domain-containing protein [Bacteroidetes bacterium]|nr:PilZ domain-containing protein [Bacteroidota bacterium]